MGVLEETICFGMLLPLSNGPFISIIESWYWGGGPTVGAVYFLLMAILFFSTAFLSLS